MINVKTYIYLHLCAINNWKSIIEGFLVTIKDSGLYDFIDEIRVCVYGSDVEIEEAKILLHSYMKSKLNIIFQSNDISLREKKTLELLKEDSQKEDFRVLYLHSKGNSRKHSLQIEDWVNYMIYFNVTKWKECINLLDTYDTCGVNLQVDSRSHTKGWHYAGNFWWSKSEHIKGLGKIENLHPRGIRLDCEQWVCSGEFSGASIWTSPSNIDHYTHRYSEDEYKNMGIRFNEA